MSLYSLISKQGVGKHMFCHIAALHINKLVVDSPVASEGVQGCFDGLRGWVKHVLGALSYYGHRILSASPGRTLEIKSSTNFCCPVHLAAGCSAACKNL